MRLTTSVLLATQRAEAKAAWVGLESELRDGGIMCSWDWTATWLAHYGHAVPHKFVIAEEGRRPCGIALITEPAARRRLRPPTIALGTAGEPVGASVFVERNRLLVRPEDRASFATGLIAVLELDGGWQRLRLDGMLPADAELLLEGRANVRRRVEECPIAELAAGAEGAEHDVLAALPASKRQRVRRALRDLGALDTEWAQSPAEADAMLDELIAMHNARWRAEGKAGAFANPLFTAFHRELIARLLPTERAALFRIRRQGETIGCLYGLREGRRMLFYQGGLRRFEDNRLRVGIAAHALFMQACRDRGLAEYDFLAPAARYKRDLATTSEQLVWAELERPGMRLRAERAARRVKRWLRTGRL